MYWVVPYLLVAAPPIIVLLSVLLGGCTATTRTEGDRTEQARFYSGPDSRTGEELVNELKRREARTELQRVIDEAQ